MGSVEEPIMTARAIADASARGWRLTVWREEGTKTWRFSAKLQNAMGYSRCVHEGVIADEDVVSCKNPTEVDRMTGKFIDALCRDPSYSNVEQLTVPQLLKGSEDARA